MADIYNTYEVVIGLEVHAQLLTKSKMYASDSASFGAEPNTQISVVTLGHPGTLPVVNKKAVQYAIKMGLATDCTINSYNEFARKNYFYADLPKGYQITQDKTPICTDGEIVIDVKGEQKTIRLQRIHLEEDAGKSMHDLDPYHSLIDLNRAGVPLVEIVSHPDMRSSEEAYQYLTEVRKLVRYLDICDGNMEEGSLRCDANVSVRKKGEEAFGERCEVKNMNSIRNVARAIDYEARRQIDIIESGGVIEQETRSFNAVDGTTFTLRSKEQAHDYRYFPEPDLPPVVLQKEAIEEIKTNMPVLPRQLKKEYQEKYHLSSYDAAILSDEKEISDYYNALIQHTKNYKAAANWILGPVKSFLNEKAVGIASFPIPSRSIAQMIQLIDEGKINFSSATQTLFPQLIHSPDKDPEKLAVELNMIQNSDQEIIQQWIDEVLAAFPDKVEAYKNGKKGLMGLFMGQIMKRSKGKADPKLTSQLLSKALNS